MKLKPILFLKNYPFECISIVVMLLYFSPLLFCLNEARFLIHDNMDGLVSLYSFMGKEDVFLRSGTEIIPGIMGELPRAVLPSPFSFFRFLFYLFSPLTAYAIHSIFQHILAWIGMRIFLRSFIAKDNPAIYNLVALAFALLPFWPGGELTVAGLPLLCWAAIKIFKGESQWHHWMIIALFPLFSSLPFGNMFSFPAVFIMFLLGVFPFKVWKWSIKSLLPFILLALFTVFSEWGMFELIFSGFKSNRIENLGEPVLLNMKGIIGVSILAFLKGHYHFHSLHFLIAVISILLVLMAILKKDYDFAKKGILILGGIFLLYFLTIFLNNVVLLEDFHFSVRFWVLFPFIWYTIFAIMLLRIPNKVLLMGMLGIQIIWVLALVYPKDYYGSTYAENPFYSSILNRNSEEHASFNAYFNTMEFEEIKNKYPEILTPNIMCIGINPGMALFSDFKTYDAYLNLYPIEKWHQIRDINQKEYDKAGLKYYSNNRAYLFSSELDKKQDMENPEWNREVFKKCNIQYLLSDKPILNGYRLKGKTKHYYIYATAKDTISNK